MKLTVTPPRLSWGLKQVESATDLSVQFLRKEIKRGRLRAKRAGRRVIVEDHELKRYLSANDAN